MSQFVDHARDILESVRKNGHVRGKVGERGRGLLDLYQLMVIPGLGDDRMEQYLRDLKALLGPVAEGDRDPARIAAKLQEIIAIEASVAADVAAEPTTFSYIEL